MDLEKVIDKSQVDTRGIGIPHSWSRFFGVESNPMAGILLALEKTAKYPQESCLPADSKKKQKKAKS